MVLIIVSESHIVKACIPMLVTLSGKSMLVRKKQHIKALFPITSTPFLIEYLPFKFSGALSNLFQSYP